MAENFDNLFYLPVSNQSELTTTNQPLPDNKSNESKDSSKAQKSEDDFAKDASLNEESLIISETIEYKPLSYHWFYSSYLLDKLIWLPMSYKDSSNIEKYYKENIKLIKEARTKERTSKNDFIYPIKGGRFEIDLVDLIKRPVYWDETKKSDVRRCLWFYKENNEQRFQPYDEDYCEFLEVEYEKALKTNTFHKRIDYFKVQPIIDSKQNSKNLQSQQSILSEEAFVFHSTSIMLHFTQANMLDEFSNLSVNIDSDAKRPRIVKRGIDEVVEKVEPDEIDQIDHLCFVIHGIGEGCDLKFRPIVDCVDDFREIGANIIDAHLKTHVETNKLNGRVEFLPISWHQDLHGDPTGVDNRLKPITLPSIPKLRQYSNSTILDVLFYTSPIYCQTIIGKVGNDLNRSVKMFMERNPNFKGTISLVGHSLGSLIVFDLLSHQYNNESNESLISQCNTQSKSSEKSDTETSTTLEALLNRLNMSEYKSIFDKEKITIESLILLNENDLSNIGLPLGPRKILLEEINANLLKKDMEEVEKKIRHNLQTLKRTDLENSNSTSNQSLLTNSLHTNSADYCNYGLAGTGQLLIKYPQLNFKVSNFFALGSPIGMFLTVRGIEKIGTDFKFPTCENFFNIFHPFDPVAYRLEPLICTSPILKPVLMPHHKGRKRMHLELREGLSKVSVDFKEKMVGQLKNAWSSLTEMTKIPKLSGPTTIPSIEGQAASSSTLTTSITTSTLTTTTTTTASNIETEKNSIIVLDNENEKSEVLEKVDLGKINKGRRIDYVLQESPIESFNEYLFALASHACYWESEDTLLLIIKEIYGQSNSTDANTELQLSDQQQQVAGSWLAQAAQAAISTNVQKTFSYFNISVPQSITSVLSSALTSSSGSPNNNTTDPNSK